MYILPCIPPLAVERGREDLKPGSINPVWSSGKQGIRLRLLRSPRDQDTDSQTGVCIWIGPE